MVECLDGVYVVEATVFCVVTLRTIRDNLVLANAKH